MASTYSSLTHLQQSQPQNPDILPGIPKPESVKIRSTYPYISPFSAPISTEIQPSRPDSQFYQMCEILGTPSTIRRRERHEISNMAYRTTMLKSLFSRNLPTYDDSITPPVAQNGHLNVYIQQHQFLFVI